MVKTRRHNKRTRKSKRTSKAYKQSRRTSKADTRKPGRGRQTLKTRRRQRRLKGGELEEWLNEKKNKEEIEGETDFGEEFIPGQYKPRPLIQIPE